MILNILLNFPEELNLKVKPSAIRENKVFTLHARQVSMESAGAEENGAYVLKGCPKKHYVYDEEMCGISLKCENGQWCVLFKDSKDYVRQAVNEEDIVEMQRYHWVSKYNPSFSRTFVTVLRYLKKDVKAYYFVIFTLCHATEMLVNHTVDHIIEKMIYSHLKTKQMNWLTLESQLSKFTLNWKKSVLTW